jgi:L-fuculose-phosphate aldolase
MLMENERKYIVDYGKRMVHDHLTSGTGGNLSILDRSTGLMAISPSGIDYYETKPEDIVIMNLNGKVIEGTRKPSSEHNLHIALYNQKKNCNAIVHTHSTYCIVLSSLNLPIKAIDYILADACSSSVPVAPYRTYGTKELADVVAETIGSSNACLMANHGLSSCGNNLNAAYSLARECEWIAEIQWRAMCIGKPNIIDDQEMENVIKKFGTYGQPKGDE